MSVWPSWYITLLTLAASPASWVPIKFVASTLANSHFNLGKVRLKLICKVSSATLSKWSKLTFDSEIIKGSQCQSITIRGTSKHKVWRNFIGTTEKYVPALTVRKLFNSANISPSMTTAATTLRAAPGIDASVSSACKSRLSFLRTKLCQLFTNVCSGIIQHLNYEDRRLWKQQ